MTQQFSLVRPKRLSMMVGQDKLGHLIRSMVKKTIPKAWGFFGATGLGKTSIARIIALTLQCTHQEKFGEPCKACWRHYDNFPIFELPANDKTGAPEIREFVSGSQYVNLIGKGTRKVYILDEAHKISNAGQHVLLKYLEDTSTRAVWIICSTEPQRLLKTIRRRLTKFKLKPLDSDDMLLYVTRLLKGTELAADDLVEALIQKQVDSPGIIAQAADKYVAGATAEEAADVEESLDVDTKELCTAVIKGEWEQVCSLLRNAPNSDARGLRASIVGYLRVIMLETTEFNRRNKILSDCIKRLSYMSFPDDLIVMAALAAELYSITEMFSEYKR